MNIINACVGANGEQPSSTLNGLQGGWQVETSDSEPLLCACHLSCCCKSHPFALSATGYKPFLAAQHCALFVSVRCAGVACDNHAYKTWPWTLCFGGAMIMLSQVGEHGLATAAAAWRGDQVAAS